MSTCLFLATLGLTACADQGEDGSDASDRSSGTPSATGQPSREAEPAPPGTPQCGDVWRDGTRIPKSYQGCADAAGAYVERDTLGCSSGQHLVRYDDRYYGVLGGTVHEASSPLDDDRDYRAALRSCRA